MNESPNLGDRLALAVTGAPTENGSDEMPPEVVALRVARQRAAEIRAAAERALREAETAEAQLAVQEEEAIAAALAHRERLAELARAAVEAEREAFEALSALQSEIQRIGTIKAQTEAAVVATRAALTEREEELRAVEASERKLQSDIAVAERNALECARARERADAMLHATAQHAPTSNGIAPASAAGNPETPSPLSVAEQRAAERRAADALRAASG